MMCLHLPGSQAERDKVTDDFAGFFNFVEGRKNFNTKVGVLERYSQAVRMHMVLNPGSICAFTIHKDLLDNIELELLRGYIAGTHEANGMPSERSQPTLALPNVPRAGDRHVLPPPRPSSASTFRSPTSPVALPPAVVVPSPLRKDLRAPESAPLPCTALSVAYPVILHAPVPPARSPSGSSLPPRTTTSASLGKLRASKFVMCSTLAGAPIPRAQMFTAASYAAKLTTALKAAGLDTFERVYTPVLWQAWERGLDAAGCLEEFSDVPIGICDGFRIGATSKILKTYTPPNHKSSAEHSNTVYAILLQKLLPTTILARLPESNVNSC